MLECVADICRRGWGVRAKHSVTKLKCSRLLVCCGRYASCGSSADGGCRRSSLLSLPSTSDSRAVPGKARASMGDKGGDDDHCSLSIGEHHEAHRLQTIISADNDAGISWHTRMPSVISNGYRFLDRGTAGSIGQLDPTAAFGIRTRFLLLKLYVRSKGSNPSNTANRRQLGDP
jgi:hypothetical protein